MSGIPADVADFLKGRRRVDFPDVSQADEHGLLAVSREITVDYILSAYSKGIFPWPYENSTVMWFAPPLRAVIEFDEFHIPSRFRRDMKKSGFTLRINTSFEEVIKHCASLPRKGQDGTWITPKIVKAYAELNRHSMAVSFETFNSHGKLVGGMYGVLLNSYFSGESMFHTETGASKFALVGAVEALKRIGLKWMDVQVINPLTASFGARELAREDFTAKLRESLSLKTATMLK